MIFAVFSVLLRPVTRRGLAAGRRGPVVGRWALRLSVVVVAIHPSPAARPRSGVSLCQAPGRFPPWDWPRLCYCWPDILALNPMVNAMREVNKSEPIHIVGGGLAGSEAAWQAASLGVPVILHEMRP